MRGGLDLEGLSYEGLGYEDLNFSGGLGFNGGLSFNKSLNFKSKGLNSFFRGGGNSSACAGYNRYKDKNDVSAYAIRLGG